MVVVQDWIDRIAHVPVVQDWIDRIAHVPVDGQSGPPDVCVIELGGTVGDIESMPFIEVSPRFSITLPHWLHLSFVIEPSSVPQNYESIDVSYQSTPPVSSAH